MHPRTLLLLVLLALGTVWARAQQNATFSQLRVKDVHIEAASMDIALQNLAKQYKVVVGMDYSSGRTAAPVRAYVADGSLKDVLDALAASSPDYSWRSEENGTVHFYNNEVNQRLSEVNVSRFWLEQSSREKAWKSIQQLAEVKHWTGNANCPVRTPAVVVGNGPEADADKGEITLQMSDVPLRKILDELAAQSGDYFWAVNRYELNGRCFTSISF